MSHLSDFRSFGLEIHIYLLIIFGEFSAEFNFRVFLTAANTNEKNTQTNLLSFIQNENLTITGRGINLSSFVLI
jgi:hypothetical protein